MAAQKPIRVVIWGPGDMGGRALQATLDSPDYDVVGVKVFSPHKNGVDIGVLAGRDPVGVLATTSKEAILALDADLVIHTPTTPALLQGADEDVVELLASGKNVVSAAAFHNPAQPTWLSESHSPMSVLRSLARLKVTGNVFGPAEKRALKGLAATMRAVDSPLGFALRPGAEVLARGLVGRAIHQRADGVRLQKACLSGGVSLHGTGLHPGLMVEQVLLRIALLMEEVEEVRFLEVGDLSAAPDGMWGGLASLGFGEPLSAVDNDHAIAWMQHFYFDAVLGNVAWELWGVPPEQVRVERHVYPVPARVEVTAGGTVIRPGTVGAIHMTYRGYIGDRLFMTNEECWHVGGGNAHLGPDHPNSLAGGHLITLVGKPGRVEMRSEPDDEAFNADWSAVTDISVNAMLAAAPGLIAASPGVVIPDLAPRYRLEAASTDPAPLQSTTPTIAVAVVGDGAVAEHLTGRITERTDFAGIVAADAASADLVVFATDGPPDAQAVVDALAAGTDVITVSPVPDSAAVLTACRTGGSTFHATGGHVAALPGYVMRALSGISRGTQSVTLTQEVTEHPADEPSLELARALLGEAVFRTEGPDARAVLDTASPGTDAPLRWRLRTESGDGSGSTRFTFHAGDTPDAVHPAVHLTCWGILAAIAPVRASAPGIVHHDLGIDHVRADHRLPS
jgi:hypothetical protein